MDADELTPAERSLIAISDHVKSLNGRISNLLAERDALRAALRECADDLDAWVNQMHRFRANDQSPRYVEDMAPVRRAREMLKEGE